jgi:tetratricopeptide (TPR) repeat protein
MNNKCTYAWLLLTLFILLCCGQRESPSADSIKKGNTKMAQGDYQAAIDEYTKAIEVDSKSMSAYYNRGQAKLSLHDYQGAIVDYSAAISLDPQYGKYYFSRAMARFALKDYRGATPDFTKSIQLEPTKRAEAYLGRGWSVIIDAGIFAAVFGKELTENEMKAVYESIRDFTIAIELNPNSAEAYCGRGAAKNILKDHQGALTEVNKAIELDSNFGEAYAHRGMTRVYSGDKSQACLDFKKAEALGFGEAFNLTKTFCK